MEAGIRGGGKFEMKVFLQGLEQLENYSLIKI